MQQAPIAVLLINLGTPDSAQTSDVRRYLNQFLTDARVIDSFSWLPRQLLVRGIISPFRAGNSAKSYREIWTEQGSPLKVISQEAAVSLEQSLNAQRNSDAPTYMVRLAMRYQNPSIESVLEELRQAQPQEYIVLPMFPQYASSATGSAHQCVMEIVSRWETVPPIRFINSYFNHPKFIAAFATIGQKYAPDSYDHVLFSFHGLPERQLRKGDDTGKYCGQTSKCCETLCVSNRFCYGAQCYQTAYLLAEKLGIPRQRYTVSFQSRLGNDPWKQPYTVQVIEDLAKKSQAKRVLVFCPAFVADCLETLFEITHEYQELFIGWGGEKLQLVESLNTSPLWIEALRDLVCGGAHLG